MKKSYDCIFLDRDGTINPDPGYISKLDDFKFFEFTIPALKELSLHGNRFCIVTNQSGVERGLIHQQDLNAIHTFIKSEFKRNQIHLLEIYVCTDLPDNATERRKPGLGMFVEAEAEYDLDLMKCLMIGDSTADIQAGEMLGMETMLVLTGRGKETEKMLQDFINPNYIVSNLQEGARLLVL